MARLPVPKHVLLKQIWFAEHGGEHDDGALVKAKKIILNK